MSVCDEDAVLEDIEDIVGEGDLTGLERSTTRSNAVVKRVKRTRNGETVKSLDDNETKLTNGSLIPGTQKIWVKTWGCAHNNSDSEYMAGQLAAYGYTLTGTFVFLFFLDLNN